MPRYLPPHAASRQQPRILNSHRLLFLLAKMGRLLHLSSENEERRGREAAILLSVTKVCSENYWKSWQIITADNSPR